MADGWFKEGLFYKSFPLMRDKLIVLSEEHL